MSESKFTESVIEWLSPFVSECEIATKKCVFYDLSFNEQGNIHLRVDRIGEPKRGGGTAFQQDILIFDRVKSGKTSIIPRVIAEVKFDGVTTHDAITYSEKARRIRAIYPFVRYGLILGQMDRIPGRVLRLGQEFDFITVASYPTTQSEINEIGNLFREELKISKDLAVILSGQKGVKTLSRNLELSFE